MEEIRKKLKEFRFGKNRVSVIAILGIVGMLLIGFSGMLTGDSKQETQTTDAPTDAQYCLELEDKVRELVTAITGDDACIVAVTLENGREYIYADQNTIDSDQSEDKANDGVTTKESRKSEQEYIIVEDNTGAQTALIVTEKKPSVRGVAIVSSGVNDQLKERILDSVSSMLGVTERKISITPKAGS